MYFFAISLLLAFLSGPAVAQLVEQFEPTAEPVTPSSVCGAVAVGNTNTGRVKGQHRDPENAFGQFVNAEGRWEYCELPHDCRSWVIPTVRDTDKPKTIYNFAPRALPDAYMNDGAESTARVKIIRAKDKSIKGHAVFVCDGKGTPKAYGGWTLKRAQVPWNADALGAK